MAEQFDPYHRWLGIRPEEQPANHYRLLGLANFEDDPEVIRDAAAQRMAHVRTYQLGKNQALSQRILNELATAKACLLNPESRAAYDLQLRSSQPPSDATEAPPVAYQAVEYPGRRPGGTQETKRPSRHPFTLAVTGIAICLGCAVVFLILRSRRDEQPHGLQDTPAQEARSDVKETSQPATPPQPLPPPSVQQSNSTASLTAPDKEATASQPAPTVKTADQTAVYNVAIEPPTATLRIAGNLGTVTGQGRSRQIRIEQVSGSGILVMASADGYVAIARWVTPRAGGIEDMRITLDPKPAQNVAVSTSSPVNRSPVTSPTPTRSYLVPTSGRNLGSSSKKAKIREEPIKSRPEPKMEKGKVFVFAGQSAILTPVQRSLPLTVEAWIWIPRPSETADMFVFGSDDATQQFGGLGVRINKNGHIGGRRVHQKEELQNFGTQRFILFQKWTHLATTFQADKIRFFIDGRPVHDDSGSQSLGRAPLVIGYIGSGPYHHSDCFFVGKMRCVRVTSGIRYSNAFWPDYEFERDTNENGLKTLLIYDASRTKNGSPLDLSGNRNQGQATGVHIEEMEVPAK
jgi:hypothetical protein